MTEEEWQSLCDGCGLCCQLRGTQVACPSLDVSNNHCRSYETRTDTEVCTKVRPGNVNYLHKAGVLPATCGYVRYMRGQQPYRLDFMYGAANLIPFEVANFSIQAEYMRQKREWFEYLGRQADAKESE